MRLLTQTQPQCLLYATAMALDVEIAEIVENLGHDGMEVQWPELDPPQCYRSFHIQEMIDFAFNIGIGLVRYEPCPMMAPNDSVNPLAIDAYDIEWLSKMDAILIGNTHAVAWSHKDREIFDPRGFRYSLLRFDFNQIFFVKKC